MKTRLVQPSNVQLMNTVVTPMLLVPSLALVCLVRPVKCVRMELVFPILVQVQTVLLAKYVSVVSVSRTSVVLPTFAKRAVFVALR